MIYVLYNEERNSFAEITFWHAIGIGSAVVGVEGVGVEVFIEEKDLLTIFNSPSVQLISEEPIDV